MKLLTPTITIRPTDDKQLLVTVEHTYGEFERISATFLISHTSGMSLRAVQTEVHQRLREAVDSGLADRYKPEPSPRASRRRSS